MTSLAEIKKNSKIDLTEWTDEEIINNVLEQKNDIIDKLMKKIEDMKEWTCKYKCPKCKTLYTIEEFNDWDMLESGCPNCGYPEDHNK